ncbi:MAG: septal ring lytic transglycosylase RlpA family protein [Flavisolibacter sp.]|nr:septal ring lytic transglycosylase RlpA family protein [Flavisolibacter sp.]
MKAGFLQAISYQPLYLSSFPLLSLFFLCVFIRCTSGNTPHSAVDTVQVKDVKTGLASYYGPGLEGKETASGKIFNSQEMVAAHPTYPLGTVARITNLEKPAVVTVRIIDRGPSDENVAEGVIIDLSKGAARKLKMVKDGRVRVKVEVLEWGNDERK